MLTWVSDGPELRYSRRPAGKLPRKRRQVGFSLPSWNVSSHMCVAVGEAQGANIPIPQHSDEMMEEGIQIAEELLWTLADSTSSTDGEDEDVVMDDVSADTQLKELRRCRGAGIIENGLQRAYVAKQTFGGGDT